MVSRAELMEEAKKLKIKGRSKMKKGELEEAIRKKKEEGDDMPESVKTPDAPKVKAGRGRPKKAPMAPVAPPPMKREAKREAKRATPPPMAPKQLEAKKAEMMKVQSSNKKARGY